MVAFSISVNAQQVKLKDKKVEKTEKVTSQKSF